MALRIEATPAATAADRAEEWAHVVSRWHDGWRVEPAGAWDQARVEAYQLGEVTVVDCLAEACRGTRVADRDGGEHGAPPGEVGVLVLHAGRETVECRGRSVPLSAGEAIVWDTRCDGRFAVEEFVDKTTLFLPQSLVASWSSHPERLSTRGPVPAASTSALRGLLRGLAQTPSAALEQQSATALGSALKELTFLTLGGRTDEASRGAGRFWNGLTRLVEDRLPDALSAEDLATELGLSVRTVYQSFADNGTTVRSYVRGRRLAKAREELLDPRRDDTIASVAQRWGFADQSAFTRAFRHQYGSTPNSVRRASVRRT